ncbi:MAG: hypothetical protein PHZ26_02840 [Candidatus Gracilibacteria bacterium]|nr:hypothetical protein [Candidatus Gracilibacteria bacterium]MDD2908669.1 hypothetical protein [Candidatus Gracilibacteria bacterium]
MNNKPFSHTNIVETETGYIKENQAQIKKYVAFLIDPEVEGDLQPCDILQVEFTEKEYKELIESKKNQDYDACFPINTKEGEELIPITAFHLVN